MTSAPVDLARFAELCGGSPSVERELRELLLADLQLNLHAVATAPTDCGLVARRAHTAAGAAAVAGARDLAGLLSAVETNALAGHGVDPARMELLWHELRRVVEYLERHTGHGNREQLHAFAEYDKLVAAQQ